MSLYELTKKKASLQKESETRIKSKVRENINEKMEAIIIANKKLCNACQKKVIYRLKLEDEYKRSEKLIDLAHKKGKITEASYISYKEKDASLMRRISALQVCFWELAYIYSNSQIYLKMLETIKKDRLDYNKSNDEIEFYEKKYLTRITYAEGFILHLLSRDIVSPQFFINEIKVFHEREEWKQLGHVARERIFSLINSFMYLNRQVDLLNQLSDEIMNVNNLKHR